MKFIYRYYNEDKKQQVEQIITKAKAKHLMAGSYRDIEDLLTVESIYPLMFGAIITKEEQ